jgi:hypothetical protein
VADLGRAGPNSAPTVRDVALAMTEDGSASWVPDVFDGDGDALSCSIGQTAGSGQATVAADCSTGAYVPVPDTNGTDTFTYRASDGLTTTTGTVTVAVSPVDDPPTAQAVNGSGWSGVATTLTLAGHDVDGDCPLAFDVVAGPAHGSLSALGSAECTDGTATVPVSYTSDPGWVGSDSFSYRVRDLGGLWAEATATVSVATQPAELTVAAAADAYVDADRPTSNFGARTDLRLDSSPLQHTYLRFSVTGLGGVPPVETVLRVHAGTGLTAGFDVRLAAQGGWTESTLTWATAPGLGTVLATTGPVAAGSWVSVPLLGVVSGDGTYEIVLTPRSSTSLRLDSRESATPPHLVLTR